MLLYSSVKRLAKVAFSSARSSKPSSLAQSSSMVNGTGAFTSLTVTVNTASLPEISGRP